MDDQVANKLIDFITAKEHNWTIIVSSKTLLEDKCSRHLSMENGQIISDLKNNCMLNISTINMLQHNLIGTKL
jgi:hypothetical protein